MRILNWPFSKPLYLFIQMSENNFDHLEKKLLVIVVTSMLSYLHNVIYTFIGKIIYRVSYQQLAIGNLMFYIEMAILYKPMILKS